MSLKFPISLVGKRASSGGDVPFATSLYDSGENLLVSIETDIPNNWNDNNTPYNATRLEIGTSCTNIGSYAFGYNSSLTELDPINPLPSTLTSIGDYAFVDTPITGSIFLPSTLSLGVGAFYGTNITDITIEMETLGDPADGYGAFEACGSIESVTLLDSCKNIYGPIFYDTQGSQFTLDLGSVVNLGAIDSVYGPFEASGVVGELSIPNTVEVIGSYAFDFCTGLTGSLVIPNSVTIIGQYAFNDCSGFTGDLVIPDSVTTIGNYAFDSCSGFTSLVIPNSVTSIGTYAFYNCSGLTTAYLAPPLANVGSDAFNNSGLTTVYANDAVANGWTLGAGQTVGGKSGVTVIDWANYPNIP